MSATNDCQNHILIKDINSLLNLSIPSSKLSTYVTYDGELNSFYLHVRNTKKKAGCPICGKYSHTVHSKYRRVLQHFPIFNKHICIHLITRKFRCHNPKCNRKIFSEQIEGLTKKYSRQTIELQKVFEKILVEVSARKGTYILNNLGFKISPTTCLRIIQNIEMPNSEEITTVGIDDWAYRKGMSYGSIVVNQATGKPIDLITSRDCDDVKNWLSSHNHIKFVTRDRATGYAGTISDALPNTQQIADKFHLVKNINDRVEEEIRKHFHQIKQSYLDRKKESSQNPDEDGNKATTQSSVKYAFPSRALRHEKMIEELQKCKLKGMSRRTAAKLIGINKCTANKYWDACISMHTTISYTNNYTEYIEDIKKYLQMGLSRKEIFNRIAASGFKGKMTAFNCWINRTFGSDEERGPRKLDVSKQEKENIKLSMLTIRKLAIHAVNPLWGVNKETGECSKTYLLAEKIIESSDMLKYLREFSMSFREVLKEKNTDNLKCWLEKYKNSPYKNVEAFVKGIFRDKSAVENAVIYSWTNGIVEGAVNRLKAIKRGMYGRANFQLLRRKVCLSVTG